MTTATDTEIQVFGQLTDLTGTNRVKVPMVKDTGALLDILQRNYPALATASFVLAVNKKIIRDCTTLQPGDSIALLPPFSGG